MNRSVKGICKKAAGIALASLVAAGAFAARCENQTAISFYPELNSDMRLYEWWLNV